MIEPTESTFDVTATAGAKGAWRLRFTDDQLIASSNDGVESFSVARADIAAKVITTQTLGVRHLYIQAERRLGFQVDAAVIEGFERWRGPLTQADLKVALNQSLRWTLPIAIFWILTSLPMDGDEAAGVESLPLDPLGMALGGVMLIIDLARRFRPNRYIFACDAAWFLALTADLCIDVASGRNSNYWLLLLPFNLLFAYSAYSNYRRFENVEPERSDR